MTVNDDDVVFRESRSALAKTGKVWARRVPTRFHPVLTSLQPHPHPSIDACLGPASSPAPSHGLHSQVGKLRLLNAIVVAMHAVSNRRGSQTERLQLWRCARDLIGALSISCCLAAPVLLRLSKSLGSSFQGAFLVASQRYEGTRSHSHDEGKSCQVESPLIGSAFQSRRRVPHGPFLNRVPHTF